MRPMVLYNLFFCFGLIGGAGIYSINHKWTGVLVAAGVAFVQAGIHQMLYRKQNV